MVNIMVIFDYYLKKVSYNESIDPDDEAIELEKIMISALKKVKVNKSEIDAIKKYEEKILGATTLNDIKQAIKGIISVLNSKQIAITEESTAAQEDFWDDYIKEQFKRLHDALLKANAEEKSKIEKRIITKLKKLLMKKFFGKGE